MVLVFKVTDRWSLPKIIRSLEDLSGLPIDGESELVLLTLLARDKLALLPAGSPSLAPAPLQLAPVNYTHYITDG